MSWLNVGTDGSTNPASAHEITKSRILFNSWDCATNCPGDRMRHGLTIKDSAQRFVQIVFGGLIAGFARFDETVIDAPAIELLPLRTENHDFGRRSGAGFASQRLARIEQGREGCLKIGVVFEDCGGTLRRI